VNRANVWTLILTLVTGGLIAIAFLDARPAWRPESGETAASNLKPASAVADSLMQRREVIATEPTTPQSSNAPAADLPWSKETLERLPKSRFGYPMTQRAFIHRVLNDSERTPIQAYQPKLDQILLMNIPESKRKLSQQQQDRAYEILKPYCDAVIPIEQEHWRARNLAMHLALERGDYVIIDETGIAEEDRHKVTARAKADLNLGENNVDSFYILTSAISDGNERGTYEALIFVRRSVFPEPFQTMDELRRINQAAIQSIRDFLGVTR
jgi:hypothetical protein